MARCELNCPYSKQVRDCQAEPGQTADEAREACAKKYSARMLANPPNGMSMYDVRGMVYMGEGKARTRKYNEF